MRYGIGLICITGRPVETIRPKAGEHEHRLPHPPARPLGRRPSRCSVKLGAVVGLMALVAVLTAVLAVNGVQSLRDGEAKLYQENVEPLVALGAIQRSFQGDRVRIVSYNVADAETRAALRKDLAERQATLQGLLKEYDGSQADDAAWTAFTQGIDGVLPVGGQGTRRDRRRLLGLLRVQRGEAAGQRGHGPVRGGERRPGGAAAAEAADGKNLAGERGDCRSSSRSWWVCSWRRPWRSWSSGSSSAPCARCRARSTRWPRVT